jgi:hypothetical protein
MMMMRQQGGMNTAMFLTKKGLLLGAAETVPNKWGSLVRGVPLVRNGSTFAANLSDQKEDNKTPPPSKGSAGAGAGAGGNKDEKGIMSYWGIQPSKITKQDGTEWKWNCFRVCNVLCYIIYMSILFLLFFRKIKVLILMISVAPTLLMGGVSM